MIFCGNDIIRISRIKESIDKIGDTFLKRVYTEEEILEYCGEVSIPDTLVAQMVEIKYQRRGTESLSNSNYSGNFRFKVDKLGNLTTLFINCNFDMLVFK